ncbi:MAG: DUF1538 family protein [Mariprofundaceae bacterium]
MKALLKPFINSAKDLAPIVITIVFFQLVVLQQAFPDIEKTIIGIFMVLIGLALFVKGLELGLFPIGESMAFAFAKKGNIFWLLAFAFALGVSTTIAEPALIAIAGKAAQVAAANGAIIDSVQAMETYALELRLTVALSVGLAITLGVLRILLGWPLHWCMVAGYMLVISMTYFSPEEIIGIAYDAGGVTTSTITVPLVAALGVGLASAVRRRNPVIEGFGLIAFASLLPMLFVMGFGILAG